MLSRDLLNAGGLMRLAGVGALAGVLFHDPVSDGPLQAVTKECRKLVSGTLVGALIWIAFFRKWADGPEHHGRRLWLVRLGVFFAGLPAIWLLISPDLRVNDIRVGHRDQKSLRNRSALLYSSKCLNRRAVS